MNEREYFAQNLKRILVEKGILPKASVLEREFNLHPYGTNWFASSSLSVVQ